MKYIFTLLILATLLPASVKAEGNKIVGLTVAPFILELEVEKGSTLDSEVTVTNNTGRDLFLIATPKDFLAGQDGMPMFIPDDVKNDNTFSLASWIKLKNEDKFPIKAGEEIKVPFTINPPADAEDGSHYGALLFNYTSGEDVGGSVIKQSVGPIILVRYGWGRERGQIELASEKKVYWKPTTVNFQTKFINEGNVHVKPKGEIYIKDIFGRTVATPFINKDGANVLPLTDRTFSASWIPSNFAFGFYRAEVVVTYGETRLEEREKIIVWVMPWYTTTALALILIGFTYYWLHGHHVYKRRIIKRHIEKQM